MSYNPQKEYELSDVRVKYGALKSLRNNLIAQKMAEVEAEMDAARNEFSAYLQEKIDRDDVGYKITVADLARAMGTTNRGTVYGYLKDARERAQKRFLSAIDPEVKKLRLFDLEKEFVMERWWYSGYVEDQATGDVYGVSHVGSHYDTWRVEGTKDTGLRIDGTDKRYSLPLDNTAPEWLSWLVNNEEWKELINA